jgi:hypothetical protein
VPRLRSARRWNALALDAAAGSPLDNGRTNPLFHHLRRPLPLEVALQNPVSDVLLDGAHVITHIVHAIRLEERYERFLIHVVLLG